MMGIGWQALASADTFVTSTTISAWKIFCSMRSSKLLDTAPTKIPFLLYKSLYCWSESVTFDLPGDGYSVCT